MGREVISEHSADRSKCLWWQKNVFCILICRLQRPKCGTTGYVEKNICSSSNRNEFKSCHSALMEKHIFWKSEGAIMSVALVFTCFVHQGQRDKNLWIKPGSKSSLYSYLLLFKVVLAIAPQTEAVQ